MNRLAVNCRSAILDDDLPFLESSGAAANVKHDQSTETVRHEHLIFSASRKGQALATWQSFALRVCLLELCFSVGP